ncbi:MAG: protein-L-isoaspartate(D-aspartate) O-methyltransferase [Burkholderiaceae bacterium]|jgi:protein-L-isoaspartate(D-aspartate) O-methyltransferase|nr:protein-L-isoaspartate(D-aspartate) O-methyltransferase [Burkholderiaceae bacterium]
MNDRKSGKFPLPLSSVIGPRKRQGQDADYRLKEVTPQTAIRNRMQPPVAAKTVPPPSGLPLSLSGSRKSPETIPGAVAMAEKMTALGIRNAMTLAAMRAVPRHLFVADGLRYQAYEDTALPIGHHQTISRPYIVARMIEAVLEGAGGRKLPRVLEIGTGCGYQAAVLAQVADEVYSIERIKALHEQAKSNLRVLRIPNLRLHYGDGMLGLPQVAPFDAIVLAAAGLEVPQALFEQLAVGGHMIAPVGREKQTLQLTKRTGARQWQSVMLEDCHFVPLRQGVV